MAEERPPLSASDAAGERAAANTFLRAGGEIVGKLATLVLFTALARKLGQSETGVFVFALAFMQLVTIPIDLGFDRYVIRAIAHDRADTPRVFWNIVGIKLALAAPVLGLAFLALVLLGYGAETKESVAVLALGFVFEAVQRTVFGVFMGYERSGLLSISVVVQRVAAAGIGLWLLETGHGVVAVSLAYTIGAAIGLVLAVVLLARRVGMPAWAMTRSEWRPLTRISAPFAVQDVFTVMLYKLDAVLLSLIATSAAVGRYGAAYRLFESTLFIVYSLAGAFSAMYTYLDHESEPTVGAVFERSLKLAMVLLVPPAIAFGVCAHQITVLFFGEGFAAAADPLRLLAPANVLLGLIALSSSLVVSRRSPTVMVKAAAAMVVLNVVLNVVLIPGLEDSGAALAMLITEVVYVGAALWIAGRTIGFIRPAPTLGGPLLAGLAMGAVMVPLRDELALASVAGIAAYLIVLLPVESRLDPPAVEFVKRMVARRLGRGAAA